MISRQYLLNFCWFMLIFLAILLIFWQFSLIFLTTYGISLEFLMISCWFSLRFLMIFRQFVGFFSAILVDFFGNLLNFSAISVDFFGTLLNFSDDFLVRSFGQLLWWFLVSFFVDIFLDSYSLISARCVPSRRDFFTLGSTFLNLN